MSNVESNHLKKAFLLASTGYLSKSFKNGLEIYEKKLFQTATRFMIIEKEKCCFNHSLLLSVACFMRDGFKFFKLNLFDAPSSKNYFSFSLPLPTSPTN
jgi:hypothetical protein